MTRFIQLRTMRSLLALLIVAGITVFFRDALPRVNQTTVALSFLIAIPNHIVDAFECGAASVFLADKQKFYRSGFGTLQLEEEQLRIAYEREEPFVDTARGFCFGPVRVGMKSIGSFGISGAPLTRQTLDAVGTLLEIAIERTRAVEQLSRTEADRQSERLKSALLDSITHNFRTPLTSIKASVTALLSPRPPQGVDGRELLEIMDQECDRLNKLVEDASEMAKLEAGEIELEFRAVTVQELVDAALANCKTSLAGRDLQSKIPAGLPPVRADLTRAKEVLVQLLENANLYSEKDQPIVVSAENSGNFVTFSVADRGPGIDTMEQGLIFDKFYRGKDQRAVIQGTGMGLPISKAIVEAHGRSINVTSQLNHGSVFTFTLPVARPGADRSS